ncbi:single-pass membrane and coiled-coil domain-containing protein 1-like [Aplochiton taeniatus]
MRLRTIGPRFEELNAAARALEERLARHRQALAKKDQQDQVWDSLPEDSLSPSDVSLLFGYVSDTLHCCHARVLDLLPDLSSSLPTTASILRRRPKNRRVNDAWNAALRKLGLEEGDAKVLCAFFVTQGYQCDYKRTEKESGQQDDANAVIRRSVGNQALKESLLKAVEVVERGKAS